MCRKLKHDILVTKIKKMLFSWTEQISKVISILIEIKQNDGCWTLLGKTYC